MIEANPQLNESPPFTGEVLATEVPLTVTEQVALALIDALALWQTPVNDSLETREAIPLDKQNEGITPKESERPKGKEAHPLKQTLTTMRAPSSRVATPTKGPVLSPFATFTQKAKERSEGKQTPTKAADSQTTAKEPSMKLPLTSSLLKHESGSPLREQVASKEGRHLTSPRDRAPTKGKEASSTVRDPNHPSHKQQQQILPHLQTTTSDHITFSDDEKKRAFEAFEEADEEGKIAGISATAEKVSRVASDHFEQESSPVVQLLNQEAKHLSQRAGIRISHFDILLIFIELMKLEIESQEEDKLARRVEREAQLKFMEKEVASFKDQAQSLLFIHLGAGLLGIVGGVAPIAGHMAGDSILSSLSSVFSGLNGMKKREFFDTVTKTTQALSDTQRAISSIYDAHAQGDRTRYNRYGDLHKTDHDEITRHIEQLLDQFRQSERFLLELLQMRHDVTSQLYR